MPLLKLIMLCFMIQSVEVMTCKEKCCLIGVRMIQLGYNRTCLLDFFILIYV